MPSCLVVSEDQSGESHIIVPEIGDAYADEVY